MSRGNNSLSATLSSSQVSDSKITEHAGSEQARACRSTILFFTLLQLLYQNVVPLLMPADLDSSETSGAPGAMGEGGSGALSNKSSEKGGSEQTRQNHGSLLVPNLRYWLSDMWRQPR